MSEQDQPGGDDVSGLWHGRYSFPRLLPPNAFTATLSETTGWIGGAIEEAALRGRRRRLCEGRAPEGD